MVRTTNERVIQRRFLWLQEICPFPDDTIALPDIEPRISWLLSLQMCASPCKHPSKVNSCRRLVFVRTKRGHLTRRTEHFLSQLGGTMGSMQRMEKKIAIVTKVKTKMVIHLYWGIIFETRRAAPYLHRKI
jgi:hypothetical protein